MAYTTINKHTAHFNTLTYTGGSGDTAHTGVGFQPDLVWIKERTRTRNHAWFDVIRGPRYWIGSNSGDGQDYNSGAYLVSLDSDGFTTTDTDVVGKNSYTYASWNWKANGAGSANTDGSINSTVSVNTTAGFSIVTYTGTGSNATVGHGLGVAPKMIMVKCTSESQDWFVYHNSIGTNAIRLNGTGTSESGVWNSTAPTNSVFSIGTAQAVNKSSGTYVAYCFAEKTGYSKFGSYIGNGDNNGPFVYTGFKPSFIMLKNYVDTGDNWTIYDSKRDVDNPSRQLLFAQSNAVESAGNSVDILSNGFKHRNSSNGNNGSGDNFIYMAFGQSLVGSNDTPCTAR